MDLVTEGNDIYRMRYIAGATIKEFYGYVVDPPPQPPIIEPPDRVSILEQQVQSLTITLGDYILGGDL